MIFKEFTLRRQNLLLQVHKWHALYVTIINIYNGVRDYEGLPSRASVWTGTISGWCYWECSPTLPWQRFIVLGFLSMTFLFSCAHKFSIIFKSGDWGGQSLSRQIFYVQDKPMLMLIYDKRHCFA